MTPAELAQLQKGGGMSDEEECTDRLARETRSSITLSRDAKGIYRWELKQYFEDGEATEALAAIRGIDGLLRADYLPKAVE